MFKKYTTCLRCKGKILVSTANKFNGMSRQCLQKVKTVKPESDLSKIKSRNPTFENKSSKPKKSLLEIEIESEREIQELEKKLTEELILERLFIEKKGNKTNVIKVLDQICFTMTNQSLIEVLA